jgi:ABC-type Fe3+ transport system permease subunit
VNRRRGLPAAALLLSLPPLAGAAYSALAAFGVLGFAPAGPSPDRIARVLGDGEVWAGLGWTVWTAGAATFLAASGAVLVATMFRSTGLGDRLARTLAVLPIPIPHLVAAAVFVLALGQSGLLARMAVALGLATSPAELPALIYDRPGVGYIVALAWKELPFLALLAFSVLATRGPALEETARSLGAGPWAVFRRVTWPLLWRGLLPGIVSVFAFVAGSYEAAVLLAPSDPLPLPLLTYERYTDPDLERRADAYVLVLLGLGLAAVAVALHEWARARAESFDS